MKTHWLYCAALAIAATTGGQLFAAEATIGSGSQTYYVESADEAPLANMPVLEPSAPGEQAPGPMLPELSAMEPPCEEAAGEEEDECPKWELFGTTCNGWHVGGWLQGGITGHEFGADVPFGGPLAPNDRAEGMLNQAYIFAEKTAKTDECCWNLGGRIDLLWGTDYIYTMATGLELHDNNAAHWNANPFYGLALPQAYVQLGGNDWDIKVGHFYTPLGYEVMTPLGNFFYSHSYEVRYAEPTTHTGVLATKKLNDRLTVAGGLVNGWDALDREEDRAAFIGGFTYKPCHEMYTLIWYVITGDELNIIGDFDNRTLSSLVFNYTINDCWTYVLQNDIGWQVNGAIAGVDDEDGFELQDAEWYGVNQYLFRTLNDCWKVGGRFEWFRDDDGVRVGGVRPGNPYPNPGFSAGNFYGLTVGANWTPHVNVTVRPELRYDWFDGEGTPPWNNDTETSQFSFAADFIVTY